MPYVVIFYSIRKKIIKNVNVSLYIKVKIN